MTISHLSPSNDFSLTLIILSLRLYLGLGGLTFPRSRIDYLINLSTYQNVCEKGTKPMEKDLAQSGLPEKRKNQLEEPVSRKPVLLGGFWDIFQNW